MLRQTARRSLATNDLVCYTADPHAGLITFVGMFPNTTPLGLAPSVFCAAFSGGGARAGLGNLNNLRHCL
jgi:hypothetical protein